MLNTTISSHNYFYPTAPILQEPKDLTPLERINIVKRIAEAMNCTIGAKGDIRIETDDRHFIYARTIVPGPFFNLPCFKSSIKITISKAWIQTEEEWKNEHPGPFDGLLKIMQIFTTHSPELAKFAFASMIGHELSHHTNTKQKLLLPLELERIFIYSLPLFTAMSMFFIGLGIETSYPSTGQAILFSGIVLFFFACCVSLKMNSAVRYKYNKINQTIENECDVQGTINNENLAKGAIYLKSFNDLVKKLAPITLSCLVVKLLALSDHSVPEIIRKTRNKIINPNLIFNPNSTHPHFSQRIEFIRGNYPDLNFHIDEYLPNITIEEVDSSIPCASPEIEPLIQEV